MVVKSFSTTMYIVYGSQESYAFYKLFEHLLTCMIYIKLTDCINEWSFYNGSIYMTLTLRVLWFHG